MSTEPSKPSRTASLWIRLAAAFYDGLLLIALLFAATMPVTLLFGGALHGEWWYRAYLLTIAYLFFGWFWIHGGQTLGMQAWRLKLEPDDRAPMTWSAALLRYCVALLSWGLFGLGFLWALWDRDGKTWHDRISRSRIVRLPKPERVDR